MNWSQVHWGWGLGEFLIMGQNGGTASGGSRGERTARHSDEFNTRANDGLSIKGGLTPMASKVSCSPVLPCPDCAALQSGMAELQHGPGRGWHRLPGSGLLRSEGSEPRGCRNGRVLRSTGQHSFAMPFENLSTMLQGIFISRAKEMLLGLNISRIHLLSATDSTRCWVRRRRERFGGIQQKEVYFVSVESCNN